MPRFTVQITFRTPNVQAPFELTVRGPRARLRLYGSEGMLAATGTVHEESPASAAIAVAQEVGRNWSKTSGPLQLVAWTAHRERALAMLGRRESGTSGRSLPWDDDSDDGGAGVREPRRPLPGPGSLSAARDLP